MANAQWRVRFHVLFPDGREANEAVYLASPDLRDTKEAKRRAVNTAKLRLLRKMEKDYALLGFKAVAIDCICVG